jgi:hypothetical protein
MGVENESDKYQDVTVTQWQIFCQKFAKNIV